MGKKGVVKNGANKKLHTKLLKKKRTKEQDAKDKRKAILKAMNQKIND